MVLHDKILSLPKEGCCREIAVLHNLAKYYLNNKKGNPIAKFFEPDIFTVGTFYSNNFYQFVLLKKYESNVTNTFNSPLIKYTCSYFYYKIADYNVRYYF